MQTERKREREKTSLHIDRFFSLNILLEVKHTVKINTIEMTRVSLSLALLFRFGIFIISSSLPSRLHTRAHLLFSSVDRLTLKTMKKKKEISTCVVSLIEYACR